MTTDGIAVSQKTKPKRAIYSILHLPSNRDILNYPSEIITYLLVLNPGFSFLNLIAFGWVSYNKPQVVKSAVIAATITSVGGQS
jgi:hypothetical protein